MAELCGFEPGTFDYRCMDIELHELQEIAVLTMEVVAAPDDSRFIGALRRVDELATRLETSVAPAWSAALAERALQWLYPTQYERLPAGVASTLIRHAEASAAGHPEGAAVCLPVLTGLLVFGIGAWTDPAWPDLRADESAPAPQSAADMTRRLARQARIGSNPQPQERPQ